MFGTPSPVASMVALKEVTYLHEPNQPSQTLMNIMEQRSLVNRWSPTESRVCLKQHFVLPRLTSGGDAVVGHVLS